MGLWVFVLSPWRDQYHEFHWIKFQFDHDVFFYALSIDCFEILMQILSMFLIIYKMWQKSNDTNFFLTSMLFLP